MSISAQSNTTLSPASSGPSSDFRAYCTFLGRVLKTFALFGLISAPMMLGYWWMLQNAGETFSTERLAQLSRGQPMLWHSAYFHCGVLRPRIAEQLHPRVAVIGSSRVMQMRDRMFARVPASDFYIAGTSGNYSLPCLMALQRLTRSSQPPELVILGLDFWWFQSAVPIAAQSRTRLCRYVGLDLYRRARMARETVKEWSTFALDQMQLYQHAWRDPRLYAALASPGREPGCGRAVYSVQSRLAGDGYRNDGSYRYTAALARFARNGTTDGGATADWSHAYREGTFSGNFMNEAALDDLREFIAECKRTGTQLIVFLPPVYTPAMDFLRHHPDSAGFWKRFPEPVLRICQAEGVPIHDFMCADRLLAQGGNFFDWYHPSEKLAGRILLEMGNDPITGAILSPYLDRDELRRTVEAAGNHFLIYGD
jgi:hypothetical protein